MSVFRNLLMALTGGWAGKPADWSDIRTDCPENSIALYAAHPADFSAYDNLGFTATCTGGYNVFIDGVQYGTTYASDAQCDITWSTSGITTGDDITTPSALKAHKIWITPATEGNNITAFHCARVASSGTEDQAILWAHFNIDNVINIKETFFSNYYRNRINKAVTAKNNILYISNAESAFRYSPVLEYVAVLDGNKLSNNNLAYAFAECNIIKKIIIQNFKIGQYGFGNFADRCYGLQEVISKNNDFSALQQANNVFVGCIALKKLITLTNASSNIVAMGSFITRATALEDTVYDVRNFTNLTRIGCYGTSQNFMSGLKGLRVSSLAPFNYATPPQIDVSYTGMDRVALVQLFNDLPTVSSGQIINITSTIGSSSLTDEELAIAENKGWTVVGGPAYEVFATYSGASIGDTIKLNDGMATSTYDWSAYPSDTATSGSYTQTATVTAAHDNIIEIATKPSQNDKSITINAGQMYYAYTNENDNTDSVYATDNPISESLNPSILYENIGTPEFTPVALDPQPEFNILQQGLVNATEYGTLTNNNGVYSGFSSSNYLLIDSLTYGNNWELIIKFKSNTINNTQYILGREHYFDLYLTNNLLTTDVGNGSSWTTVIQKGNTPIQANKDYYVKYKRTGNTYNVYLSETESFSSTPEISLPAVDFAAMSLLIGKLIASGSLNPFNGNIDFSKTKLTVDGIITTFYNSKSGIVIGNDLYERNSGADEYKSISGVSIDIDAIDNTTIQAVAINTDQTATIETSANITTSNNDNVITDGSYHLFNLTIPTGMTPIIENSGISYQTSDMPLLLKSNTGVGLLLKDGNNAYYRNSWVITRDYDLHYQQINFSYPSGATVTCKVNNVPQNDLTPYAYVGDVVTWTCDNAGTVTTGSYTVKYSTKDGNIQTITIS